MSKNTGTLISATVRVNDSLDTYPSIVQKEMEGSYRTVETLSDRNSITTPRRAWGMWVNVIDDPTPANNKVYELKEGTVDNDISNNSNWIEAKLGVSFTGTTGFIPKFFSAGKNIQDSLIRELATYRWSFGDVGKGLVLNSSQITSTKDFIFPDKSGTVALLSDIQGNVPTAGKNNYLENTLYSTVGEIIYHINNEGETLFYEVLQSFTSANTGDIQDSLDYDSDPLQGNNLELKEIKGLTLEPYVAGAYYPEYGVTWKNGVVYRTIGETFADPENGHPWEVIGFSDDLTQGSIWIGDSNGKKSELPTDFYILDNVGSTFLTEAYLITNYPNAEVFQAVESTWQLAIKTAAGWSINKKNENELISIDVDLSDTDIFTADGRILDIAHLSGVDVINFNTTFTPPEIIAISTATPAVVEVDNTQLLQNNRQFDIDSTTYEIKAIDHTAKTFELYASDGTTPIDGNNIQALIGDTLTIPTGTDLIIRIDEILGVSNNFHLQATADSGNEVRFHRFAVATATTNQIVGESNGSSINIIGSDNGKSILRIRRSGTLNVVGKELIVA